MASSDSTMAFSILGASTSRQGLPGIMPADFAARSIAPETNSREIQECVVVGFNCSVHECIFYHLVDNLILTGQLTSGHRTSCSGQS